MNKGRRFGFERITWLLHGDSLLIQVDLLLPSANQPRFISPGKPMENGIGELVNGRFRDECLNEVWFRSFDEARKLTEEWRQDYNTTRPHGELGRIAPSEFAH